MTVTIKLIVEGHGEVRAAPALLHRINNECNLGIELLTPNPIRQNRSSLVNPASDALRKAVELAALGMSESSAIVLLLDSDGAAPCALGPDLKSRMSHARSDIRCEVILAHIEFESWFLAAADSLRGFSGLPDDLAGPIDPEAIQGAKEWLRDRRTRPVYSPTVDQEAFVRKMDLALARRARSFDRFYRKLEALLRELSTPRN